MEWRYCCSSFILLFFVYRLPGALTSTSIFATDGIFVNPISIGRNLLATEKGCPVSFEFLNYSTITSQCKPPEYPEKQCCDAIARFACPFRGSLNNLSYDCVTPMFSYINGYGGYPTGLFSKCIGDKEGLLCPALEPSQSVDDDTNSSKIKCELSTVLMIATIFMEVFMTLVLLF